MTTAEAWFNDVALPPRKPKGSLGRTAATSTLTQLLNYSPAMTETVGLLGTREPRTSTPTFTQLLPDYEGLHYDVVECVASRDDDELMLNVLRCQLTY